MASLQDIPKELLTPTKTEDFIKWLIEIPLPMSSRKAMLRIWSRHTVTEVPPEAWARIEKADSQTEEPNAS